MEKSQTEGGENLSDSIRLLGPDQPGNGMTQQFVRRGDAC